jgi:hypothetical protein
MTVSQVHVKHARLIVVAAALLICAGILWLTRTYNFYFDEWDYILAAPDWTLTSYLQPHNVHPAMLHRLVYTILLATVGLRSYVPYMVVLLALHATSAFLLFEIVRRRAGDLVGIACALLLLVLGAGWENLLWAFQIMFLGSVACGLAMLLVLQGPSTPSRMALVTALLLASLMFSAVSGMFAVAAAVYLAASPERRRDLIWLVPVAVLVVAWYMAYGRSGAQPNPPPDPGNLPAVSKYVLWGLGSGVAALIGQGGNWVPFSLAGGLIILAWTWRKRGRDPFALAIAAGLLVFYLLTALSRAQLGFEQSAAGRYVYEGALFWLLLLADAARPVPWRRTWRPALVACVFLACFSSSVLLFTFAAGKTVQMQRETADLQALDAARGNHCLNPAGAVDLFVMPQVTSPALYYRAIDRYGDPVAGVPQVVGPERERARANLLISGCV